MLRENDDKTFSTVVAINAVLYIQDLFQKCEKQMSGFF